MTWKKNTERVTRAIDRLLQLGNVCEPPVHVELIAQLRGIQLRYVPLEDELAGLLLWEDGRAIIGVNQLHRKTRQRFAVAHELGHLELQHHSGMHIDRNFPMPISSAYLAQAIEACEWEASAFAAELLVPSVLLERDLKAQGLLVDYDDDASVQALAERYQVSSRVMSFRLLGI